MLAREAPFAGFGGDVILDCAGVVREVLGAEIGGEQSQAGVDRGQDRVASKRSVDAAFGVSLRTSRTVPAAVRAT